MPNIKLTDFDKKEWKEIVQQPGETLGHALQREGYPVEYACGGRGICGKCRFRVIEGETAVSVEERRILTKEELERGERLLCRCVFLTDGAVFLPRAQGEIAGSALPSGAREQKWETAPECPNIRRRIDDGYEVAVDIGTTTIALALRDCRSGQMCATLTRNNSQRSYGADVLSRITAANNGHLKELQTLVWRDIIAGMDALLEGKNGGVRRLAVAANTTMQHLLAGDSCETLGQAPFTPVSLKLRKQSCRTLYREVPERYADMEVILLPGISAFVGADIVSGMYECRMAQSRKPVLLLDIGTNGEMVLGDEKGFLVTSTAAGPALEGAGISCGVPGIEGAVNSVALLGSRLVVHTIGGKKPVGLCGTGALELAYELLKQGIADETGTFRGQYRETGYPIVSASDGRQLVFTQEDMRQLQMAKAAIRSGIELLLAEKQLSPSLIDKVYLAGGLGYKMNVYKAAGIGLLPMELRDKAAAVGNSSLAGALRYLAKGEDGELERLVQLSGEMNLATHPKFEDSYYRYMNFN